MKQFPNRSTKTTGPAPQWPDLVEDTQPTSGNPQTANPLAETRYHVVQPAATPKRSRSQRSKPKFPWHSGCLLLLFPFFALMGIFLLYLLAPGRTNVLILGLDSRPGEGDAGRSDTMILTTFIPLKAYVGALSIPRDLWVKVPGYGENRINTAHFFGELEQPGGGPRAAMNAIQQNFGVNVDYYLRARFDGFREVVNSLGGVDVTLPSPMSGFPAGLQHMDGDQALALVRDRKGSDDFFRMERGQLFLKAVWKQILKPQSWPRLPKAISALSQTVDTNIPFWLWPRLGVALLRAGPNGLDTRAITREMVTPFVTSGGAQVLGPNWNQINPVLMEVFGQ